MSSIPEAKNHLQVVARIEDYYQGFIAEPLRFTSADYQKVLADLARAAGSILAVTEILARLAPPGG
jgi:hypothetical protein